MAPGDTNVGSRPSMIDYAKVEEQERSPMIEYLLKLYIDLTARPTELGRDAN
jgi:hypothetical protein